MTAQAHQPPESPPVQSPPPGTTATAGADWKDPKRYLWLLGPALPGIGLAALTGYALAPKKLKALAWDRTGSGTCHHSGAGPGHRRGPKQSPGDGRPLPGAGQVL